MVKKNNFTGGDHKPGGSATVMEGDIIVDVAAFCACISDAIDLLKECQAEQHAELIAALEAILVAIQDNKACLLDILQAINLLKECNTSENELLCKKLEAILALLTSELANILACLVDIKTDLSSVVCPAPACAADGTASMVYTNTNTETEMTISVGSEGDVKIDSGFGDGSEAEITQYITDCLAAGNNVSWMATGAEGETASGTLLASATTNAFPNFYNDSTDAAPAVLFKVVSLTATCLAEQVDQFTLKTYDKCSSDTLNDILAKVCLLTEKPMPDVRECCVPPDPENRDRWCQPFNQTFPVGSGDANETLSVGIGTLFVDLPNPYTEADLLAAIESLNPGAEWAIVPNANGENFLCRFDGPGSVRFRARCCNFNPTPDPDPTGPIVGTCYLATSASLSLFVAGDDPECFQVLMTEGCYDESIANSVEGAEGLLEDILQKQCDLVELGEQSLDKQCLLLDAQTNPNACGSPVPEQGLDKEAQTLNLEGDVGAKYPAGTSISLKDANGNICGSATSTGVTSYNETTGLTTVTIEECELAEGKTAVQIATAAPVLQIAVQAVKNIIKRG